MTTHRRNPRILAIVHHRHDDVGAAGPILRDRGVDLDVRCHMTGDPLPTDLSGYDGILVTGGTMSALDDHLPEIRTELGVLERAIAGDVPLFGICLGSQLIARVLGGRVWCAEEGLCELGFRRVTPTEAGLDWFGADRSWPAFFQWHQDSFDLPAGATCLATGSIFENQAFRFGDRVIAIQFHPEGRAEQIRGWLDSDYQLYRHRPGADQLDKLLTDIDHLCPAQNAWLADALSQWQSMFHLNAAINPSLTTAG